MNSVTKELKPERLWFYFEELSQIPRASKNEAEIIDYILSFARKHRLDFNQDRAGNVVIRRLASPGFERKPTVVLQAHVDMVCEKNEESGHDFSKDPINLKVDGEWVRADETSLGADNGIGVAAMLSLLEDSSLQLGKLECLFTVDEETGMGGAINLDTGMIEGRFFLNLDTEECGTLYIGCAGGKDSDIYLPVLVMKTDNEMTALKLGITGLSGGHSGAEIHKGKANGIKLMVRVLNHLKKSISYHISSLCGGDKHNAIPREAFAVITVRRSDVPTAKSIFNEYCRSVKNEYGVTDPDAHFQMDEYSTPDRVFETEATKNLINLLMTIPHGVLVMSASIKDLVETSTNLSSVKIEEGTVHIHASHRSSTDSALEWMCDFHRCLAEMVDARIEQDEGYPAWNPNPDSKLLEHAKKAVRKTMGKEAEIKAIHAGLECGVIKKKFEGMDALSIGPTITGAHSPGEKVNIKSVLDFWNLLRETLTSLFRE